VPLWLPIVTDLIESAPSLVLVLLAVRVTCRPLLLLGAGVVALVSSGPRGDRAQKIVKTLTARIPRPK
jgi:hypothetical protein